MTYRLNEIRARQRTEYMVNVPNLGDVRDVNQALRDINYLLGVRNQQAIELGETMRANEKARAEIGRLRADGLKVTGIKRG